jgi:hypothetical protein
MPRNAKLRAASEGPWVASGQVDDFLAFCKTNGHETRLHPDPWIKAHQVKHQGHWMAVIWNNSFKRYTADRRLSLIVQSFATEREATR